MAKKLTLHWRLLRHDLLKPDQYHEEAVQQLLGYSVSKQSYQLEESSSGKLPQSLLFVSFTIQASTRFFNRSKNVHFKWFCECGKGHFRDS